MDAMTASAILAEQLEASGLSVMNQDQQTVSVMNPLHPGLGEIVTAQGGRYLTDYGYEIGEHGDEPATADRVVALLGLPRSAAQGIKSRDADADRRPLAGGRQWDARPEHVETVTRAEQVRARLSVVNHRSRTRAGRSA